MLKRVAKFTLHALGIDAKRTSGGLLLAARTRAASAEPEKEDVFASKITFRDIEKSLLLIGRRWQGRDIVILADQDTGSWAWSGLTVNCKTDTPARIGEFDPTTTVFLYACDSDDIGLPYVSEIVGRGGIFFPVQVYTPSSYSNVNDTAKRVLESECKKQSEEGFDKFNFGFGDSLNIMQAITVTAHLPGDYVELGCFRGSSACVALAYMNEIRMRRNCYFLDVFEGFNYQAAKDSSDAMWAETHNTEGMAIISRRISTRSNPDAGLNALVFKSNVIEDRLPEEIGPIAVANIDVDLYEAVLAGLVKIAPKMVSGGIIIVEDPGHTPALIGSRLALQEFLGSAIAASFVPIYLESGQTFLIRIGAS